MSHISGHKKSMITIHNINVLDMDFIDHPQIYDIGNWLLSLLITRQVKKNAINS